MEVAIIGTDDFVTGFALAGVKNTYVADENVESEIEKVLNIKEIGVLVMEEGQFNGLNIKARRSLEKTIKPVLITISDKGQGANLRELVEGTGKSLSVELGPGLLSQIYDGVQRPLPVLKETSGDFIKRGIYAFA